MASHMALVNITGQTKATLKVTLKMDFVVVKAFGNEERATVINMKASTKMIRNGDMESLLGPLVMRIKDNIGLIIGMAMAKCIGFKAIGIKAIGKMASKVGMVTIIFI